MQRRRGALSSRPRVRESRVVGRRVLPCRDRDSVLARLVAIERARSSEWVLVLEDAVDLKMQSLTGLVKS